MDEKISIIVPVYNVEKYLSRCIESLIGQTYGNLEIILVDDGSSDISPKICDMYAVQDKRIKVIHKKNEGLSEARNTGLKEASGDYIMYVDSDDYIELDSCKRLLSGMQPEVDFVVGAIREIRENSVTYQRHTNLIPGNIYCAKEFVIRAIQKNEWFAPAVLNLYRRDFLIRNQLFYKSGFYYEDMEMLPRLFLSAKKVVYVDYLFYNYIVRKNSIMTSDITEKKKSMMLAIYNDWMKIIGNVYDEEYRRYLYGILIRYYMTSARRGNIRGWKINGMNFWFAWRYALNKREKVKVFLFDLLPVIYVKL